MSKDNSIVFHSFTPELAHHFKSINQQWIEAMFVMEDIDMQVLNEPQKHIISAGGHIWFAQHPEHGVVGTGALYKKAEGIFELTKMGVLDQVRGLKIGELLLQYILLQAKDIATKELSLLTNSRCEAAIHLYQKNGFVHDKEIMHRYGQAYARCNVAMKYLPSL
jgi:N-acetylglutamate synthase-like GNAT family acetyltransferase